MQSAALGIVACSLLREQHFHKDVPQRANGGDFLLRSFEMETVKRGRRTVVQPGREVIFSTRDFGLINGCLGPAETLHPA